MNWMNGGALAGKCKLPTIEGGYASPAWATNERASPTRILKMETLRIVLNLALLAVKTSRRFV
jgi:hypothetical protein